VNISGKSIIVSRDISGVLVPHGHLIELKAGTPVRITQSLGGNHSVEVFGNLVMVDCQDQDALGIESDPTLSAHLSDDGMTIEQKAIQQLKTCYDPEIPVNIYDLGLILNINVLEDNDSYTICIAMTLTSPSCGMGPFMIEDVKRKLHIIPNVKHVQVELAFDPPWNKNMMSKVAKLTLNML
tara:strand:- start:430 stop:975 length:546 start_codon:yes stop_codon:yes gene_type:complete